MQLTKLLDSISCISVIGEIQRKDISGIFYDSRKVTENSVFVAVKGYKTDGHKFILDAINKGALAVVLEEDNIPDNVFIHHGISKVLVKNSRKALAEISSAFYNEPSKKLKLIGITGTNGKTTTAFFIKNILEMAGEKVGLIGTITNYIGNKKIKTSLTTPESAEINGLLLNMVNEDCDSAVMEVSSHSLALDRVANLEFKAAVFTNITSDHLDFHGNFENYLNAKKILFNVLPPSAFGVYNCDDENGLTLTQNSKSKLYSYGTAPNADFILSNIKYDLSGTSFSLQYKGTEYFVSTSLVGDFNAYNACAAFAVSVLLGVDENTSVEGIKTTEQVPGRFEVIKYADKKVIIDYSHTSDSLEKTLKVLNKIVEKKFPIYTVFGCGGDRDKTKRPEMGKIASELSGKAIITSDNPRSEDPFSIIEDIKKGITKNNFSIIENREEAIRTAIFNSEENAAILIAGKGHEDYQEINGIRNHFSDKETAEKFLVDLYHGSRQDLEG